MWTMDLGLSLLYADAHTSMKVGKECKWRNKVLINAMMVVRFLHCTVYYALISQ